MVTLMFFLLVDYFFPCFFVSFFSSFFGFLVSLHHGEGILRQVTYEVLNKISI